MHDLSKAGQSSEKSGKNPETSQRAQPVMHGSGGRHVLGAYLIAAARAQMEPWAAVFWNKPVPDQSLENAPSRIQANRIQGRVILGFVPRLSGSPRAPDRKAPFIAGFPAGGGE
ncbi:hypothetical protein [Bosea vaviloviae]|uniref:hypothetical protein n=1 Tax=Bosea vaviloviae TaxID=1526658 RepID=UPI0011DFC1BA|nr:hypothetical protein [Bosea vaviloviae]